MAQAKDLQPNNLFHAVKKGKNFHRRTQSTNAYDFDNLLNLQRSTPGLMEEIAKSQGVADTNATKRAIDASVGKQEEKHVIVEDIDEIPKSIGWVVPKLPKSNMNPLHVIQKRDLSNVINSNGNIATKKLEKFTDKDLVNDLTGLNVIMERHQSIENSDMDAVEFKSDKNSTENSHGVHSRTNSWNDSSLQSGKPSASNRSSQGVAPSTFKPQHRRGQLSMDLDNRLKSDLTRSQQFPPQFSPKLTQISELLPQHSGSQSAKNVKDKFNITKKITPETAKNFLKVLDKHRKSPSLGGTVQFDARPIHQKDSGEKKPLSTIVENLIHEDEKITVIKTLETKISKMNTNIEELNNKTATLQKQMMELTNVIKTLQAENSNLRKVMKFHLFHVFIFEIRKAFRRER